MSRREVYAIGHIPPSDGSFALWCSWCDSGMTPEDERKAEMGAIKSHGICPSCVKRHFPDESGPATGTPTPSALPQDRARTTPEGNAA